MEEENDPLGILSGGAPSESDPLGLLKKKTYPDGVQQMYDQVGTGISQTSGKPSAEDADAERVARVKDAFSLGKHANEKQSFRIPNEQHEAFTKEVSERADSIFQIYNKKAEIQLKALEQKYTLLAAQKKAAPEDLQAQYNKEADAFVKAQNKLMNDQVEYEYANIASKYEKMPASKTKKDAGFFKSAGKQAWNAVVNQLPTALAASENEALPSLDIAPRENGELRFKFIDNSGFGNIGKDLGIENSIFDMERRIDQGDDLATIINGVDHPLVKKAVEETLRNLKGSSDRDVFKSTFTSMFNREAGKEKQKNIQEIEEQNKDSQELLNDVPLTWKEAQENGNLSGYVGGAIGQGLGSSLASVPLGVYPGARAMEFGEVYSAGLQAKAKHLTSKYGATVTPEMLASTNNDDDVIETASVIGNINAGLESAATVFGLGKLAKNIFLKKVSDEIVKRSLGKQALKALGGFATSAAVGAGTEMVQSANTLIGAKSLGGADKSEVMKNIFIAATNKVLNRKIKEGQSLDDAAASITDEEIDEIFEAGLQGAIAEGAMGGGGEAISFAKSGRQAYFDKKRQRAITREEAIEKIQSGMADELSIYNDPELEEFQVGITSATDKTPEVKALMDTAREHNTKGEFEQAEQVFNQVLDIGEKEINSSLSKVPGASIKLDRTKGDFFSYTEPTFKATLSVPSENSSEAFAALADSAEKLNQDAIHISKIEPNLQETEEFGVEDPDGFVPEPNVDIYFDKPITNFEFQQLVKLTQQKAELAGFTLHPDKKGINLYNISKFTGHEEFRSKLETLKQELDSKGIRYNAQGSVRRLLNVGKEESGATRSYKQIRELRGKNVPQTIQVDPRTAKVIEKSKAALSSISPNLQVQLYKGNKEGAALLKSLKASEELPDDVAGFYNSENDVVGIDVSKMDKTTPFHEAAIHPIVNALQANNPELFKQFSEEAGNISLKLEDGSITDYKTFTGGDKEEALVEFLSDFASAKFDKLQNSKNIITKARNFIKKILRAIGIKSADVGVNLDNVKELKKFAKRVADAIGKGQQVKLGNKKAPKRGTQFQKVGKKKLNQTAKKVLFDRLTKFKQLQTDIATNPKDYSYDPQKFKDIDQYLESLSDVELMDMIDINNSMAVLAGIKLLHRLNAKNIDTRPVFKKLREIGTGVGQLLRQFGELKHSTPEGIVQTVLKNLESMDLTLTDPQLKELEQLAKDHINAINDKETKRVAFIDNPNDVNDKALSDAQDALAKSFEKVNTFIGKVTPMGVDSMISTILQGNLLTSKSIVTNVLGNLVQQPIRLAEIGAGDLASYIVHRMKGVDMMNPMEMWFGATLNGLKSFGKGTVQATKDITKGQGNQFTSTLEYQRNLKPWQAIQQIFTKAGRATLPVDTKGKVPMSVYIEKAFEGFPLSGWTAEGMFRLLYLGDKPFKEAARMSGAFRLFAESGGKGPLKQGSAADFRKFMANLTPSQNQKIQEYADEATFSNKRTLAKGADAVIHGIGVMFEHMADRMPTSGSRHVARALAKTLLKANIPFVRVPSNLLQYLMELALPIIPLIGSGYYGAKGDVRKSAQLAVRAFAGCAMYYMANMLYDAGVIIASGKDDEDNERQLKHEIGRPNGINVSALARHHAGVQDPNNPYQEGDKIVEFTKFGMLGMFLAYNAELNESIKKDHGVSRSEVSYPDLLASGLGSMSKTSLEMSFMQGAYTALDAMKEGDYSNYIPKLLSTYESILIPNQFSAYTRSKAPYILRAEDKSAMKQFYEITSTKLFPQLKDNITGVYPIIGMFGDPAQQNPQREAGSWAAKMYQFFDITNSERIVDGHALEVFNLFKKTGKIPFTTPTATINFDKTEYTLTEQDYIYAQMIAGKIKRMEMAFVTDLPIWKELSDDEKIIELSKINEIANKQAKKIMTDMIDQGVEAGSIVMDEKTGTYKYTSPSEFDFDYAKKAIEE